MKRALNAIILASAAALVVALGASCRGIQSPAILDPGEAGCGACGCFPVECGGGMCCPKDEVCLVNGMCEAPGWTGPDESGNVGAKRHVHPQQRSAL